MGELDDPVVVQFPLRGDGWMAVTTPAARVPSHGVDMLGQRYAFDFVKVDDRPGVHVHPASTFTASTVGGGIPNPRERIRSVEGGGGADGDGAPGV